MNNLDPTAPLATNAVEPPADDTLPTLSQEAASGAETDGAGPSAPSGDDMHMRALIAGLDLSEAEWLAILNAKNGRPSEYRQEFGETVSRQALMLGECVYDDIPCAETKALGQHLNDQPFAYKIAVLEVIERFWSRPNCFRSLEEQMTNIGVCFCENAHQRMQARRRR